MLRSVLAATLVLVVSREDNPQSPEKIAQMAAIASAVAEFARTPDEAAFALAWGENESHFSLRIHQNRCRPWECDRGKARSVWQFHRNGMSDERWARMVGVENTRVQSEHALRMTRWALARCPRDRVRGAFRALGGKACTSPLRGEEERVADFNRLRARL